MTVERYREYESGFLTEAGKRYGVAPERFRHVGGFENLIYGFERDGREYILRVTHESHRSAGEVASELHWMRHLAEHDVRVARPVEAADGLLPGDVRTEAGTFLLSAFERAPGGHVDARRPEWGPRLFERWGELTGRMHRLAAGYEPPPGLSRRRGGEAEIGEAADFAAEALEAALGDGADQADAATLEELAHAFGRAVEEAERLPRSADGFGMCHRDLHHGNFFVDGEGGMTAFDFDDCGYDFFIQDVAMPVYYGAVFGVWEKPEFDPRAASASAERILDSFLQGYGRERTIGADWLRRLPLFVEKRRVDLCLVLFGEWGPGHSNEAQRAWLAWNADAIRQGVPCLELKL
ncbi:phosphotransferase enzyme family protein [Paenibacillus flagellatus]|nr:phosphotransferase [Paenibacillus flagellatus]